MRKRSKKYVEAIQKVDKSRFYSKEEAVNLMKNAIADGSALNKLRELIVAQKGDPACIDDYSLLPTASIVEPLNSIKTGYVQKIKTQELAIACKILGAGREKKTDNVDFAVGVVLNKKVGDKVELGEKLLDIHANNPEKLRIAKEMLEQAFVIEEKIAEPEKLIHKIIE